MTKLSYLLENIAENIGRSHLTPYFALLLGIILLAVAIVSINWSFSGNSGKRITGDRYLVFFGLNSVLALNAFGQESPALIVVIMFTFSITSLWFFLKTRKLLKKNPKSAASIKRVTLVTAASCITLIGLTLVILLESITILILIGLVLYLFWFMLSRYQPRKRTV